VYGEGLQLRDYVHVNDVVRAFLVSGIDERTNGQVFNVGSGQPVAFRDMAYIVIRLAKRGSIKFVEWPADAAQTETGSFVADISLIKNTIGWSPRISLEDGLAYVIREYKEHFGIQ